LAIFALKTHTVSSAFSLLKPEVADFWDIDPDRRHAVYPGLQKHLHLKGLSHEIDIKNFDRHFTELGLRNGRGRF
jgi:hypothetical protein